MPELEVTKRGTHIVELWDFEGCGIVVDHPTGIFYTNQAGGGLCDHPKAEGFFLPLNDLMPGVWERLHSLLCGFVWDNEPVISEQATAFLEDRVLPAGILVDRKRLLYGEEAWVPVVLSYGFGKTGWFTYPNCD